MRSSFFLLSLFVGVNAGYLSDLDAFKHFQQRFAKKYATDDEYSDRFVIFQKNLNAIVSHNLDTTQNFTMGVNQFTDMTPAEFKAYTTGFTPKYGAPKYGLMFGADCSSFSGTGKTVPDSYDWRSHGAVTPIKDQGQCGSCWSFSATGSMEGAWAIEHGDLVSLSEQELVDCAGIRYGNMGCNGGLMDSAFQYAIDKGMCTESSYAYTSGVSKTAGTCTNCDAVVSFSGCADVAPNNQVALKEAVSMGPVSVAIEADTRYFQSYSGGVLTAATCGTTLDHGVLVVGYGEENGQKYWLVKNSWGTSWGDAGYVKIARSESTNDGGVCGIAMQPSYPIV